MRPGIGQREVRGSQDGSRRGLLGKLGLERVVAGIDCIFKLRSEAETKIVRRANFVQHPMRVSRCQRRWIKRIGVHKRGQLARLAAHISHFHGNVPGYLALDIQVVLNRVRCSQIRIDKEHAATAKREEACGAEVKIPGRRL